VKKVEVVDVDNDRPRLQAILSIKRFASMITTQRFLSTYIGFGAIWAINVSTIFRSSWAGDDWPISQTPYWIQWRYGALTNWNIWTEAMFWNDQWMRGAGRFYPLTWIESRFVFSYLTELWQYKFYQVVMLFIAGLLLVVVCFLFSRSHSFAIFVLASLSLTIQFRRDFDPHLAFAVMLPSLLIKIFLAVIFAYFAGRRRKTLVGLLHGLTSGVIFFAAMSTYEFGFLLFPMLVIAFLFGSTLLTNEYNSPETSKLDFRRIASISFAPIAISWIGYGLFVFGYLRPRAGSISGSYVLGLSWSSVEVFLSQAAMGLPLISIRDGDFSFSLISILVGVLLIILSTYSFRKLSRNLIGARVNQEINDTESSGVKDYSILLILFSSTMILSPGFMMAMQPSWWNRADLKHTYLGVMITEFGTAVVLAFILNQITNLSLQSLRTKKTNRKKRLTPQVISSSKFKHETLKRRMSIFFALILIINFNHNWRVSGENTARSFQYNSWQHLTKTSSVFKDVKESDIFISTNQNDAFETNAGSFYANTGIRLAYLFNTNSIFPNFSNCVLGPDCALEGVRQKSIATLPNLTRGTFVPRLADKSRIDDWVGINSRKGALDGSTIWAFDTFLLTSTTYFSFLAPFLDDEKEARIDFTKLKVVTITSNPKNDFGPAIANVCLVQDGNEISRAGFLMTQWKVPVMALDPSGALVKPTKSLDFREIEAGTCVLR
jgi:hypothetical protein